MSEEKCCDGAVSTLIIYFNGKRKFFETMLEPPVMAMGIFNVFYEIRERSSSLKATEKFELEN